MRKRNEKVAVYAILIIGLAILSMNDFSNLKIEFSPCNSDLGDVCNDDEYCGDGICQASEDEFSCYSDCNLLTKNREVNIADDDPENKGTGKSVLDESVKSTKSIFILFLLFGTVIANIVIIAIYFKLKSEEKF